MAGKHGIWIFWTGYFAVAAVLQLLAGDFPSSFFEFPVNIASLLLWAVVIWVVYREFPESAPWAILSSWQTTCITLGFFIAACLVQGFCPAKVTGTWWFVAAVLALISHLLAVFLRGALRPRPFRARFILNHGGILLALAAGLFGGPDTREWRTVVDMTRFTTEAVDSRGQVTGMRHGMRLAGIVMDSYRNGTPKNYEAAVLLDSGERISLKVNHPYPLSWMDDIYLAGVDGMSAGDADRSGGSCIVQIVRQPWKYVELAGILMLMAGSVMLFLQGPAGRRRSCRGSENAGKTEDKV